jgi:secondary thiamine-phosphate synthase enzyme
VTKVQTVQLRTRSRTELLDITSEIQAALTATGVREGVAYVYCPHTTAGVAINENADPSVKRDFLVWSGNEVPERGDYHHAEGNSDSHIKSVLTGPGQVIPVGDGRLLLGTWQGVFFCEYDGPRSRRVLVKVIEG